MTGLAAPLDRLPDPLPIEPLEHPFDVTITPPGSKSLTCRAYVLAALAEGESTIGRPLRADDTDRLLDALCALGAEARWSGEDVTIRGVAGRFPRGGAVNLGDGGAPARFMIAAATLAAAPVVVDGSPRMRQRPVAEGVDLLRGLGAQVEYVEQEGRLPVRVGAPIPPGGEVDVPTTLSSQFISAALLVGACLPQGVVLRYQGGITSESYVRLTRGVLADWGADLRVRNRFGRFGRTVEDRVGPGRIRGRAYAVEPDASSAVYFFEAASIIPGSRVTIPGLRADSIQPDIDSLVMLEAAGVSCEARDDAIAVRGSKRVLPMRENLSRLPDAALALAAVAAVANGTSRFTGLKTLRVKESDRIAALAAELAKIGCSVATAGDSITIDTSGRHDRPARIETYRDHRMAMAFGVLGLARPGLSIAGPACVSKSYPSFWSDLARLYDSSSEG